MSITALGLSPSVTLRLTGVLITFSQQILHCVEYQQIKKKSVVTVVASSAAPQGVLLKMSGKRFVFATAPDLKVGFLKSLLTVSLVHCWNYLCSWMQ